jgi:iron complex outermembrane receptor protein
MKYLRLLGYGTAVCLLASGLAAQTAPAAVADSNDTVKLPSFTVSDTQDKGYLAANSVSATRISTPIADLPFAVSAFTQQFITDTGAQDIGDIVQYAAGVSNGSNGYTFSADFYLRGFQQYPEENGFFEGTHASNYVDSSDIERVEVVKGPASLLYGQIQPGGTVNYITKSPQEKAFVSTDLQFGSYNFGRATLDINQPLVDKTLLFRFVGSVENGFQFVQPSRDVVTVLAPSLKWNVTPILSMKVQYQGYHNKATPQVFLRPQMEMEKPESIVNSLYSPGYPGFSQLLNGKTGIDAAQGYPSDGSDPGFLNAYPGFGWNENINSNNDFQDTHQDSLNLEVDLNAGQHWTIRGNFVLDHQAYQYLQSNSGRAATVPPDSLQYVNGQWSVAPSWTAMSTAQQIAAGLAWAAKLGKNPGLVLGETQNGTPTPELLLGNAQYNFGKDGTQVYQAEAAGDYKFNFGSIKPLFGVFDDIATDVSGSASSLVNHRVWDISPYSPTHFVDHTQSSPFSMLTNVSPVTLAHTSDQAIYGVLNASFLNDTLYLVGGARYNQSQSQSTTLNGKIGQGYKATYTTPQIGLGFKVTKEVMLYANYSTADQLPGSSFLTTIQTVNGQPQAIATTQAAVQTGKGYEVGIKTTLLNDRISGYIAAYDITEGKVPQSAGIVFPNGQTLNVTFDDTEIVSKGIEAEFTFSPLDNWQIFVSASEDDARFTKEPPGELYFIGQQPAYFTKTLANLWTRYTFTAPALKGLWVGGGVVYHGKSMQDFANNGATWPSYPLWNASIGTDWTWNHHPISAMVNGQNLNGIVYNVASQMRGQPRRLVFSVKTTF